MNSIMSDDLLLNELINKVKITFAQGTPSGILLHWDEKRFLAEISEIVQPMQAQNETDFNYAFCNRYSIDDNSDQEHYIGLWISCIADVFSLSPIRRINNKTSNIENSPKPYLHEKLEEIQQFFTNKNFFIFPESWDKIVIPEITLELSKVATLGKCLFEDFEGSCDE